MPSEGEDMGFWDQVVHGTDTGAPPPRQLSTPARGAQPWYPTPQYSPQEQEPWAQPGPDSIQHQAADAEASQQVLDLIEGGDLGTTTLPMRHQKFGKLDEGSEYFQAALHGGSRALKSEPHRCPQCGDPRFFTRGGRYRPICMACSYCGDNYSLSTLN